MNKPDRAGQPVRSKLDGTLGITASGLNSEGYIDVMFLGSIGLVPFDSYELELTELVESK